MNSDTRTWHRSRRWPPRGRIVFAAVLVLAVFSIIWSVMASSNTPQRDAHRGPAPTATLTSSNVVADQLLTSLKLVEPAGVPDYERDLFGGDWGDADRDCESTRTEVLIRQSRRTPLISGCEVIDGLWNDPWSQIAITDPTEIDIDHTVPLANAWRSGAWHWTTQQRVAFANDLQDVDALLAVSSSENRAKGDSGPEQWRPPDRNTWCRYARSWARTKAKWGLTATRAEWQALQNMAATC